MTGKKNVYHANRDFNVGDKVLVRGIPYSSETHTAKIISEPEEDAGGNYLVGIKYWYMGSLEHDIVNVNRVLKTKGLNIKMSKAQYWTLGVLAVVAILFFWVVGNFNSLVGMNEDVDNSWSKVETSYQRRYDLIGNLVESVKGSQLQEQTVFKSIADARKQYSDAGAKSDENGQAQAASKIETNVALIPRLQEAYPELKSNQNVQSLMGQLTGTEDGIATARNTYNDVVTNYNKGVQQFPKVVFASAFGYHERAQFKADSAATKAPTVNFSSPAVTTSPAVKQ